MIFVETEKLSSTDVELIRANWGDVSFRAKPYTAQCGGGRARNVVGWPELEGMPFYHLPVPPLSDSAYFRKAVSQCIVHLYSAADGGIGVLDGGSLALPEAEGPVRRATGYLRGYTLPGRPRIQARGYGRVSMSTIELLVSYIEVSGQGCGAPAGVLKELKRIALYPFALNCRTADDREIEAERLIAWVRNSREATEGGA